uniref:Uncharacterized protein n=1 Tax=Arundo donax TaxID=35708 RepID=A0A0A9EAZ7_ARUDO
MNKADARYGGTHGQRQRVGTEAQTGRSDQQSRLTRWPPRTAPAPNKPSSSDGTVKKKCLTTAKAAGVP